ncbi:MAG: hypothetical protein ACRBDL_06255 [Alphaproteobacteria bacterium]
MSKNHKVPLAQAMKQADTQAEQFIKEAIFLPSNEGEQVLDEYLRDTFSTFLGSEKIRLKAELIDIKNVYEKDKKTLNAQRDKLSKTDCTIPAPAQIQQSTPNKKKRSFRKFIDLFMAVTLVVMAAGVLSIEVVTIAATILSSGNPVFIDAPWTAWMMAGLVPVGAFSIKFLKSYLPNDSAKKRYALFIYLMSTILLLIWMILFSLIFDNIGADINIGDIMNSSDKVIDESALTMIQLLSGSFVGGALLTASSDLIAKYSPSAMIDNPEYLLNKKIFDSMTKDFKPISATHNTLNADNAALDSAERNFMTKHRLAYKRLRARFDTASVPSFK